MEDILIGTQDRSVLVFIPDPASTTGAGKTGLAAAAITVTYTRVETDNDVVHADVTSSLSDLSALTDAHADWGWKEVSATLSKGLYRLDIADAVFASGAWYAVVQVTITSGTAAATPKAFRLVARNDLDAVRLGLTALPNAAADAAGGLPISDAGGLGLDAQIGTKISDILTDTGTTLQAELDGIQADTEDIQSRLPAALTGDGNIKADTLRVAGTTQTARDLGASVLLSPGTGTGQLDITSGVVKANLVQILASAITGTAAQLSAAFTKWFNVATPTGTVNSLPDAAPDAAGGLPISDAGGLDLDAIGAKAASLTFTVAGKVDSNIKLLDDDATDVGGVQALARLANGSIFNATAATGTLSTTQCTSSLAGIFADDYFTLRCAVVFLDGDNFGLMAQVVDYVGASGLFTFSPALPNAVTDGDSFLVIPSGLAALVENNAGALRYTTAALANAPSGTGGDATEAKQDAIIAALGTPAVTGGDDIAAIKSETASILTDTAEIGTAGAGLTALATAAALATVDGIVDDILTDTADMQPKLGTPSVDLAADIAAISGGGGDATEAKQDTIIALIGTPASDVSADIAAVKAETASILTDTAEIGTAGAGLTDLGGMSTTMKAQVNTEADSAASDYGALKPTTGGRTLDVSAGGEAGVDWANVGSPTTTVVLSGTTVKTATDVETDTSNIQSRLPAALTGAGNMKSDTLAINGATVAGDGDATPWDAA